MCGKVYILFSFIQKSAKEVGKVCQGNDESSKGAIPPEDGFLTMVYIVFRFRPFSMQLLCNKMLK